MATSEATSVVADVKRNEQYVICTHCGSKILAPAAAVSVEDKEVNFI